jgi:hypothetical protein
MSEILGRRLTLRAAEITGRKYDRAFVNEIEALLANLPPAPVTDPKDWRFYVDQELVTVWPTLDKSHRLAVYITASRAAHETVARSSDAGRPDGSGAG